MTKHIKNATWPEGCGQRNEKTRKRENQKTEKTRKREIENQKTGTLWPFSGFRRFRVFRVFAVFAFSPFSRFSCFRRFRIFAVSRPQVDSSRFRVSRFRVHRCFHMFSPGVFVLQNGLLRYTYLHMPKAVITFVFLVLRNGLLRLHTLRMPKAVITFMFKVLRNGLLRIRYILYTCPKL